MVKMGSHRQKNYKSQDALCSGGTLKTPSYLGKILSDLETRFFFLCVCVQYVRKREINQCNVSLSHYHVLLSLCLRSPTVQQKAWAQCGGFTSGMTTLDLPLIGTLHRWKYLR